MSTINLSTKEEITAPIASITEEAFDEIKPSQEELLAFYDTVFMREIPFTKKYKIGTKISVELRTRTFEESEKVVLQESSNENATGFSTVSNLNKGYLAFSLKSIDNKNFDSGTYEERLERINKMPLHKALTLLDCLSAFDGLCEKCRQSHLNF